MHERDPRDLFAPAPVTRRQFIVRGTGALAGFHLLGGVGCAAAGIAPPGTVAALAQGFADPPLRARPGAYWVWVNGHFDRAQMTRELEDLKEMGLSGVEIFDIGARGESHLPPAGPAFMSPDAIEGVAHALREAGRLGLEMGLITSSSWNAGGPWVTPEIGSKTLYHSEVRVGGPGPVVVQLPYPDVPEPKFGGREGGLEPWSNDAAYSREIAVLAVPARESRTITDLSEIRDLTRLLRADGRLEWEAPPGEWSVLRIVCTNNRERVVLPSPHSDAYMIDHLSAEATEAHFRHIIGRLTDALGPLRETALKYLYLPSYEVRGLTEWTPTFAEEFRARRGYEISPFLPVLFGWTIANSELSARFDHDRRVTVSDLLIENHYARAAEICHEHGLELHAESGGPGRPFLPEHDFPAEALRALNAVDVPRGEFWVRNPLGTFDGASVIKAVASSIHIYGKQVAEMESFTGFDHWERGPFDLKPFADRVLCEGANRFVFHTYPHNPPEAGKPGWSYHAGTHVGMNRVWWPMARPFLSYLASSSFLLQEGIFVADVGFYTGHDAPLLIANKGFDENTATLGQGYDYDYINTEVLLTRAAVRDGRIILPDGMSYAVLVLPDREDMPLDVAEKLEELVRGGATLLGPRPVRTPGLHDPDERVHRDMDARLRELADRLWSDIDGGRVTSRTYGEGRVFQGVPLREVLARLGLGPDFVVLGGDDGTEVHFIHRRVDERDLYFVSNQRNRWESVDCVFRVSDAAPELWLPDTGERRPHPLYAPVEGGTRVHLELPPYGSVFVVFGPAAGAPQVTAVRRDGTSLVPVQGGTPDRPPPFDLRVDMADGLEVVAWRPGRYELRTGANEVIRFEGPPEPEAIPVRGPWEVRFPSGWGAPEQVVLPELISWTEHPDPGVRFFSGIASYHGTFRLPGDAMAPEVALLLDLGDLRHAARVHLNEHPLGIVWKPPYVLEIGEAAVAGENRLRIEVANVWANRLLGDRDLPPDRRFTRTNVPVAMQHDELIPSGLLGPVRVRLGRRHRFQG